MKRLFFFEVDIEISQNIPVGTTFAMSLECNWTEDIPYSASKPIPGQPLETSRMFICSPDRSNYLDLLDRFKKNINKYGIFTSLKEMVDEKAKTKFENIALLYKDVDDLKYSYCRKSFRVMLTPNNEMIMVNVLTDSDKNVIFTAEKNSIVGTNAMFICLITMLKDNGIADAGVMKVSEYLNL